MTTTIRAKQIEIERKEIEKNETIASLHQQYKNHLIVRACLCDMCEIFSKIA